jgi:hypothetical protein
LSRWGQAPSYGTTPTTLPTAPAPIASGGSAAGMGVY